MGVRGRHKLVYKERLSVAMPQAGVGLGVGSMKFRAAMPSR